MNNSQPVLYLLVGYPGSGKTTTSKAIHELTGATHLWADQIRKDRFGEPTHSHEENLKLYSHLNQVTSELLAAGQSVIFDTNFNFYKDREHLRAIAEDHGAKPVVIWVRTPKETARKRATANAHAQQTRILGDMPLKQFERISHNLQEPRKGEYVIELDGTKISKEYVADHLKQVGV
ncbi:MAG: hypothetical protein JWL85_692 [Candidatus Saccharibacteria bacterium]|nr:hypothetical protein [Candidatus Saccharibacteria bacterium]